VLTGMHADAEGRPGRTPDPRLTRDKDGNIIKSDKGLKIWLDGEEELWDVPWGHGLLGTGNSFATTCHQVGRHAGDAHHYRHVLHVHICKQGLTEYGTGCRSWSRQGTCP
jgi:hypothetical protein